MIFFRFLKAKVAWLTAEELILQSDTARMEKEEEERGQTSEEESLSRLSEAFTLMQLHDHVALIGAGSVSSANLLGLEPERHLRPRPLEGEDRTTVHRRFEEMLWRQVNDIVRQLEKSKEEVSLAAGRRMISATEAMAKTIALATSGKSSFLYISRGCNDKKLLS